MSTKPQAHATKWTVVVGVDRLTLRLFADQAKAETERDFHVQHGRQAYLLPPVAAGGTPITVHATFAHVHDQLKAPAWASWPSRWTLKRSTPAWLMRPASCRTSRKTCSRQDSPRTRT